MSANTFLRDWSVAEWVLPDPGASGKLPASKTGLVHLVSAAAETRTLANPASVGLLLMLEMKTDGGDITVTADTAINQAGDTVLTFNDAGDFALLMSVQQGSTKRWKLLSQGGSIGGHFRIARGETALDASNPTPVAHGLGTVTAFTATLKGTAAPGVGTSILTANINGANVDVYAWKVTTSTDNTLIASTGTESFYWVAVGLAH